MDYLRLCDKEDCINGHTRHCDICIYNKSPRLDNYKPQIKYHIAPKNLKEKRGYYDKNR